MALYYTFDCSVVCCGVNVYFLFNERKKNEVMKNVKMKMHASEDRNEEDGFVCLFEREKRDIIRTARVSA
jgi:hypothetical protein